MVVSDSIGDMLARIKNGYLAKAKNVVIPHSTVKEELGKILVKSGYLENSEVKTENKTKILKVALKYEGKKPVLTDIKRVSRPGLRIYVNKKNIPQVLGGLGTVIISTPKGLLTNKEVRKLGLGGEVICKVW